MTCLAPFCVLFDERLFRCLLWFRQIFDARVVGEVAAIAGAVGRVAEAVVAMSPLGRIVCRSANDRREYRVRNSGRKISCNAILLLLSMTIAGANLAGRDDTLFAYS